MLAVRRLGGRCVWGQNRGCVALKGIDRSFWGVVIGERIPCGARHCCGQVRGHALPGRKMVALFPKAPESVSF